MLCRVPHKWPGTWCAAMAFLGSIEALARWSSASCQHAWHALLSPCLVPCLVRGPAQLLHLSGGCAD